MNVRIIAATNRNLELMIKEGGFREDLYYRLNVFPLHVPALKERIDDIAELVDRLTPEDGAKFDNGAMQVLENYTWPGNVRELANLLERMAIQHPGKWISETDLPERIRLGLTPVSESSTAPGLQAPEEPASALLPVNGIDLKEYLGALEKGLIQQALDDTNSVVARAADRLHVRRTTLVEKMRKYGMQRP
jgi:sigma-54 specific flagellar transcriptional regulator A